MIITYVVFICLSFHETLSVTFYPYGLSKNDFKLEHNDDKTFPAIPIRTQFPFFGNRHSSLFVNTNGDLTFLSALGSYTPQPFPYQQNIRIIAAYWGDVNTIKGGDIWYRQSSDSALLHRASMEIRASFPQQARFNASWIFISTWDNLAHHVTPEKRSTFQCVLVTDGRYAFVMFMYLKTEWIPAQVGFDAGDGVHYYAVPKSLTPDIVNLPTKSNVNVPGKFIFRVDLETIEEATNVDECLTQVCHNYGTCTDLDGVSTWKCTCIQGYTGINCETDIDECESLPCQNAGSCVNLIDFYKCHCEDGYEGLNCEIDINECASNPCLHGATCRNLKNDYSCECSPGYTGRHCEIDIDECHSNPCYNNGTCVDQTPGWDCMCVPGYTGAQCKTDKDECDSNPCQQNGTCIDLVNAYKCICSNDSTGEHCERWINHCSSSPCLHGGVCTNKYGGFECSCQASWYGDRCVLKYMNRTEVCTDLKYTECSCYIHQLKSNVKSNRIMLGSIGVAFGFCISLCVYCILMCLNSLQSYQTKITPEIWPSNEHVKIKEDITEPSAKSTEVKDKKRDGPIPKKRHHDCFTDHNGFDFAKLYIEKYGRPPKCRHTKSEV